MNVCQNESLRRDESITTHCDEQMPFRSSAAQRRSLGWVTLALALACSWGCGKAERRAADSVASTSAAGLGGTGFSQSDSTSTDAGGSDVTGSTSVGGSSSGGGATAGSSGGSSANGGSGASGSSSTLGGSGANSEGGAGSNDDLARELVGLDFVLHSTEGFTPVEGTTVHVRFESENGTFFFAAGCNVRFAPAAICGDGLCIDRDWSDFGYACSEERHSQDDWLTRFFAAEPTLALNGDTLSVTGADAVLVFRRASGNEVLEAQLSERDFTLESAQGFTPVMDTTVSIGFHSPTAYVRSLFVSAGCASLNTNYLLCGDRLCIITMWSRNDVSCSPALDEQDRWLEQFFTAQPGLATDGDVLTITGPDATLVFRCDGAGACASG